MQFFRQLFLPPGRNVAAFVYTSQEDVYADAFFREDAMKGMGAINGYFSRREQFLWLGSVGLIVLTFLLFRQGDYFSLVSSLIGVTALILLGSALLSIRIVQHKEF